MRAGQKKEEVGGRGREEKDRGTPCSYSILFSFCPPILYSYPSCSPQFACSAVLLKMLGWACTVGGGRGGSAGGDEGQDRGHCHVQRLRAVEEGDPLLALHPKAAFQVTPRPPSSSLLLFVRLLYTYIVTHFTFHIPGPLGDILKGAMQQLQQSLGGEMFNQVLLHAKSSNL